MNTISDILAIKPINILITNVCNLKCAGCLQLVPYFNERWFIELKQLESNIEYFRKFDRKQLRIYGGEPTIHPKWNEILNMLFNYSDVKFYVFSNGVKDIPNLFKFVYKRKNLVYQYKNIKFGINKKSPGKKFVNTLNALRDNIFCNNYQCALYAFKNCRQWLSMHCGSTVYDNKAYFCEPAGAWERLKIGSKNWVKNSSGWDLFSDRYVFSKTNKEVIEQASLVCYQCGWAKCHYIDIKNREQIASSTNCALLKYLKIPHLF